MDVEEVKNKTIGQEDKIAGFFKRPKQHNHFKYYFYITKNFRRENIDDKFKKKYIYFYVMNRAGLRRPDHFDKYFELLSNKEVNLAVLLEDLYEIPRNNGSRALFLSFATKLIHTVDNNFPIYDKNISMILNLPKFKYDNLSLEQKINQRIEIYEELKNNFNELLADEEILSLLSRFRVNFEQFSRKNNNFEWENDLIKDVKLLDSILWASYQI